MTIEEALAKMEEKFPGQFVGAEILTELRKHPGETPIRICEYRIYAADLGYKHGPTFEDCFKQI